VRYSFGGLRVSALGYRYRSQVRGECSERLDSARASSGHALLAGIRRAASMRAAWPRSSKSSSAARSSNTVVGEGGGDVGSAGLWVGVGASAQPQQFSVVEVHPGVFCQPQSGARACSVFAVVAGRWPTATGTGPRRGCAAVTAGRGQAGKRVGSAAGTSCRRN
jgi:hypothetical protein